MIAGASCRSFQNRGWLPVGTAIPADSEAVRAPVPVLKPELRSTHRFQPASQQLMVGIQICFV